MAESAWRRGDYKTAATLVIEAYGAELYSFLLSQFRGNSASADEVFAMFREDFWRGLPSFQWRCSSRAWSYRLVRNAASRYRRSPENRSGRNVPLSQAPFLDELVERARSTTLQYLRSEVKDEFQRLRDQLSEEERDLLVLRVDRKLAWREIAHAMLEPDVALDEECVRRFEASLRQRFVELKKRLHALAKRSGLL